MTRDFPRDGPWHGYICRAESEAARRDWCCKCGCRCNRLPGGHTALPRTVGPELGSRIVRIVMIHRRTARPVVTVEILAVADRRIERETPDGFHPSQRREHRRSMLELIGIVRGIETVRTERPVLITGLEIEKSGLFTVVVHPQVTVVVLEIGVVDIPVAATVRPGGKKEKRPLVTAPERLPYA